MIEYVAARGKEKRKKKRRIKWKIAAFCLVFFFAFCFCYYFFVVCPIVVSLSKDKIHSLTTASISDVVGEVLSQSGAKYGDLVKISYSSANEVEVIEVDTIAVNILAREVTSRVQQRFDLMKTAGIDVAIGTFSGIPFLYGVGPAVSVQLVPVGIVKTNFDSQFVSAGINQTLHRLKFIVSANVGLVLPARTQNIETQLDVVICESVIVGKIPNIYLQGQIL